MHTIVFADRDRSQTNSVSSGPVKSATSLLEMQYRVVIIVVTFRT